MVTLLIQYDLFPQTTLFSPTYTFKSYSLKVQAKPLEIALTSKIVCTEPDIRKLSFLFIL